MVSEKPLELYGTFSNSFFQAFSEGVSLKKLKARRQGNCLVIVYIEILFSYSYTLPHVLSFWHQFAPLLSRFLAAPSEKGKRVSPRIQADRSRTSPVS